MNTKFQFPQIAQLRQQREEIEKALIALENAQEEAQASIDIVCSTKEKLVALELPQPSLIEWKKEIAELVIDSDTFLEQTINAELRRKYEEALAVIEQLRDALKQRNERNPNNNTINRDASKSTDEGEGIPTGKMGQPYNSEYPSAPTNQQTKADPFSLSQREAHFSSHSPGQEKNTVSIVETDTDELQENIKNLQEIVAEKDSVISRLQYDLNISKKGARKWANDFQVISE